MLFLLPSCAARVIPYVMTWDGIVTILHRRYSQNIGLTDSTEAYIQGIVLKKTLESISFDYRRGLPEQDGRPDFGLAGADWREGAVTETAA